MVQNDERKQTRPTRHAHEWGTRFVVVRMRRRKADSEEPAFGFGNPTSQRQDEEHPIVWLRYSAPAISSCSPSIRMASSSRSSASIAAATSFWTWAAASSSSGESATLR
jgi:hypothetical protein